MPRKSAKNGSTVGVGGYDLSDDEMEFMRAIQEWKDKNGRSFPTWSEILGVLRDLGYRKEKT